jgi:outer membrane protein, heavy metal efflux system
VLREQLERRLSHEMRDHYGETLRISRARRQAGEISEAELRKIELEGLKYENGAIDADMELDVVRSKLAALLGLPREAELPESVATPLPPPAGSLAALTERALAARPDVLAVRKAREAAEAALAREKREALPDLTVGVSYTRSRFAASGDNPNTLGLGLSMPLPIFDRNQAGIGRARVAIERALNDAERVEIRVREEVSEAIRRAERAGARIAVFEGGMLERAEKAQLTAEQSYRAGAISLLELLEAQRTYLETRADYLRADHERRRATIDLLYALGSELP